MASTAYADDADPVAQRAGEEANLETTAQREGMVFAASLGPAITVGGGGTGAGGNLSLKIGTVAGPRSVIWLEFGGSAAAHRVMDELKLNQYTHVMIAGQYYVQPAFYLRLGAGFGAYQCNACRNPDDRTDIVPVDYHRRGLAGEAHLGLELVHFRSLALSFEAGGVSTITAHGLILGLVSGLVLSID